MTRQVFLLAAPGLLGAVDVSASRGAIPDSGVDSGWGAGRDSGGKAGGIGTRLMKLEAGTETRLTGAEAHHASVKRLRAGEVVDLVDGRGWRAGAELVGSGTDLRFRLVEAPRFEACPALRLTLIQALAKEKRDLQALEAACEIGALRVVPWGAARSVSRWDGRAKQVKGREKWQNLAVSALKQSRQSRLAEVGEYVESAAGGADSGTGVPPSSRRGAGDENSVFAETRRIIAAGGRVFVLHESASERLSVLLRAISREAPHEPGGELSGAGNLGAGNPGGTMEIAVVVGPEGGITEGELEGFRAMGAEIVLLGSSVLRCSTAGPVALAIIQATLGSW